MSSLSKQIANLGKSSNKVKKGKVVSLLFSQADAAEVDAVTLLELARNSLGELQAFDPRFNEFASTLFDTTSTTVDRTVLNPEENNALDQSLSRCLLLLSPYLSTKAAHRVLEYLIRQYQVNEYNVNSLMECALMYHDSDFFSRLLETLHIEFAGSKWLFLKGFRGQKAHVSRKAIVDQISRDPSMLDFIGNMLFRAVICSQEAPSNTHWQSKISWYTATIITAIESSPPREEFLRGLFPQILRGMSFKHAPVLQVGFYLVVIKLVSSVELSDENVEALLIATLKSVPVEFAAEGLTCAASIANSGMIKKLSPKAFHHLSILQPLDEFLSAASVFVDVSLLTSLYLEHALQSVPSNEVVSEDLCRIIRNESSQSLIANLVTNIIIRYAENPNVSSDIRDCYGEVLACSMESHPSVCDVAVKKAMQVLETSSGKKKAGFDLLTLCSHSNLRHLPVGDTDTTFILALENHDPKVRLQALQEIVKHSGVTTINSDLHGAVIRRLSDDDASVVSMIAGQTCRKLLVSCFSNEMLLLEEIWKVFCRWSAQMESRPVQSISPVTSLLEAINDISKPLLEHSAAREVVILANFEQLPLQTRISQFSKLGVKVSSYSPLVLTVVEGLKSLGKTQLGDFAALSAVRKESGSLKKWEDVENLAQAVVRVIAKNIGGGKSVMFEKSWLQIAARGSLDTYQLSENVSNFILVCVTASIEHTKKGDNLAVLLKHFISMLPQVQLKLFSLPSEHLESQRLISLLSTMVVKVPHKETSFEFIQQVCSCLLSLPVELFDKKEIQLALRHMFEHHFNMTPVWYFSCVIRSMVGSEPSNVTSQLRVLALTRSFLTSILETESSKPLEETLSQVAFSLPLWLSLLEHAAQPVRVATLELLDTVSQFGSVVSSAKVKLQPPSSLGYETKLSKVPTLAGSELVKFCSLVCLQKSEIAMDRKAISTCVFHLFAADTPETSWKKSRVSCMSFLVAHLVNLGENSEWLHVVALVFKQLAYKMGKGSESSLTSHRESTWGPCESMSSYLIQHESASEEEDKLCAKVLNIIISELVLCAKDKVEVAQLSLVESLLNSVEKLPNTPLVLANQASAKHLFSSASSHWCGLLNTEQTTRLFSALIKYGNTCPSFMHSICRVVSLLNITAADYVSCLTESMKNKAETLDTILELLGVSVAEMKASPVKQLFSLVDSLFQVLEYSSKTKEDGFKKCILTASKLLLQLISREDESSKQFNASLEARLDSFIKILQLMTTSSCSREVKATIIQVLVEFSKISPNKVFSSVSTMVQDMLVEAAANNDITLLHFVEHILTEVIPYLSKSKDSSVNIGVFLKNIIESFEGSDIWKLNLFSSLVRSLSADILPVLVVMTEESLSSQLDRRTSPSAQLASSVKLLECTQLCLRKDVAATTLSLGESNSSFMRLDLTPMIKSQSDAISLAIRCAEHVAAHGESKSFHYQLLRLNDVEKKQVQSLYLGICQQLLFCIHDNEEDEDETCENHVTLSRIFDRILNNLQNLLSVTGFIVMMQELLQDSQDWVRKRAIELLTGRVQSMRATGGISSQEATLFVDMMPDLNALIVVEGESASLPTALCAIEILAREFAPEHQSVFLATMDKVVALLGAISSKPDQSQDLSVLCSGFLCAATLCGVLGLKAFPYLSKLVPILLNHLRAFKPCEDTSMQAFLLKSVLSLFISLFQYLPQFLHPNVEEVINLTQGDEFIKQCESPSVDLLIVKLYASIGRGVSVRLLFPTMVSLCRTSLVRGVRATSLVLHMFREMLDCNKGQELKMHAQPITKFLFECLEFREKQFLAFSPDILTCIESDVIESLICWVLKMNENDLAGFLTVLLRWKRGVSETATSDEKLSRRLTFHRVLELLTNKLKSIIVPYFDQFFDDCVGELQIPFQSNAKLTSKAKKQRISRGGDDIDSAIVASFVDSLEASYGRSTHLQLLKYVVSSLGNCFENDRDQVCMNTKRVQLVMQPLIRHLAFAVVDQEYVDRTVVPSIAQLAVLCGGDVMWKPLNHGVLMQTRDSSAVVRLHALMCVKECFSHVGEEFLTVLPESLSFLSELLEDSDPEVEAQCRAVLKYIETVSGENIDEYL